MTDHVSTEGQTSRPDSPDGGLGTSLKPRHITMISIAGVIGAGLFVGSANAIKEAGPAVLISYFMAGTLVVLVMRMWGERGTAPDARHLSERADAAQWREAMNRLEWPLRVK